MREKLIYYPAVTRESFQNYGRITELIESGKLMRDIGVPEFNPEDDRFMLCGSPGMLKSLSALLEEKGFRETKKSDFASMSLNAPLWRNSIRERVSG